MQEAKIFCHQYLCDLSQNGRESSCCATDANDYTSTGFEILPMNRRQFVERALALPQLQLCRLSAIESGKPSHRRPNLLYVSSD